MLPTVKDKAKLKADLAKFKAKLTDELRLPERAAVGQLRQAIRKVWMRHPVKLYVLLKSRAADMNPATKTKWVHTCAMCSPNVHIHKSANVEVDHITGNHTFTRIDDFPSYYDNILNCSADELQVLCKECHAIKTYAEQMGISLDEAEKEKEVILWIENTPLPKQKALLKKAGLPFNNKEVRRESYRQYRGSSRGTGCSGSTDVSDGQALSPAHDKPRGLSGIPSGRRGNRST